VGNHPDRAIGSAALGLNRQKQVWTIALAFGTMLPRVSERHGVCRFDVLAVTGPDVVLFDPGEDSQFL
jgi:hypothetical protein